MTSSDQSASAQKTLTSRAVTAGIYIAAITIVLNLIIYIAGMNELMMTNTALKWLNNLVQFGIVFYFIYKAAQLHRDIDRGGFLSVGNGLGLGSLAGLVSGIISAVWMVIFVNFIAPDLMDQIKQITIEQMQQRGQSEEQIEQAMEFSAFFFSPTFMAIIMILFLTFLGFLGGLISGLLLKKERPLA